VLHDYRRRGAGRRIRRWRVAEAGVVDGQHGIGQVKRLLEFEGEIRTRQQRREALHAVQRLDPALRLLGLAGLGLEAVDEFLQVGDLVLLLGERRLLQRHLLGAHILEGAVVAAVARQLAVFDMDGDVGHGIEKFTVVAYHQHGAGVFLQPGFQPHQRVQIEVVGGFVEQQQIGRAHQRTRQLQTHAPAAGKAVDRLIQLAHLEAQAEDQRLRARLRVVGAGVVQRHVGVRHALAIVAFLGSGDLGLRRRQQSVAVDDEVGRGLARLRHVLRHLRHAPLRRHGKVALVFVQGAVDEREQAGLAGAVAPDQADLFAWIDRHRRVVEQDLGATPQAEILEDDHAEDAVRRTRPA